MTVTQTGGGEYTPPADEEPAQIEQPAATDLLVAGA